MIRTGRAIVVVLIFLTIAYAQNPTTKSDIEVKMEIDGTNEILVPEISILSPSSNWSYGQSRYMLPIENQSVSGTFSSSKDMAGENFSIHISNFKLTDYFQPNFRPDAYPRTDMRSSTIRLNDSGQAHFTLVGLPSGIYNFYILDDANKTRVSILPLLVTQGELFTDSPTRIRAGDILKLNVTALPNDKDKIYAAIMLSRQDFENASLIMTTNGTLEGLNTAISLGSNSAEISGMPRISYDFILSLLSVLPENSGLATINSTNPQVGLSLITDPSWKKGDYLLNTVVYSQGKLMGLNQSTIEVA
jgi:hypothetical protein